MLELFQQYKEKGETSRALLAGQNMVNRNPGDSDCFEAYFGYLLFLAEKQDDVQAATSLIHLATGALSFFSEHADIDEHTVDLIVNRENELDRISGIIDKKRNEIARKAAKEKIEYNDDALNLLGKLLEKINECTSQADFNKYLNDMGAIDQRIKQETLVDRQENLYAELTQKSSVIVNAKMAYFENIKNREYNISAIEAYEKAFNMFKSGKVGANHKEILQSLFSFDPLRLYNETLVYYNHVYNYILSQLNDEEKFTMTKYAIMCEKKR